MTQPARRAKPVSARALRYHLPLVLGLSLCAFAGWFELSRARDGHSIAWLYAFEWPAFGVVGVIIWWRIVSNPDDSDTRTKSSRVPRQPSVPPDDPGLLAWQRYLAGMRAGEETRDTETVDPHQPT